MALSQTDVDNLETALASGELTVQYNGKSVTFRSVKEIKEAIGYTKSAIEKAVAGGAITQSFTSFSRD